MTAESKTNRIGTKTRVLLGLLQALGVLVGFVFIFLSVDVLALFKLVADPENGLYAAGVICLTFIPLLLAMLSGFALLAKWRCGYQVTILSLYTQLPIVYVFDYLSYFFGVGAMLFVVLNGHWTPSSFQVGGDYLFWLGYKAEASLSIGYEPVLQLGLNLAALIWLIVLRRQVR